MPKGGIYNLNEVKERLSGRKTSDYGAQRFIPGTDKTFLLILRDIEENECIVDWNGDNANNSEISDLIQGYLNIVEDYKKKYFNKEGDNQSKIEHYYDDLNKLYPLKRSISNMYEVLNNARHYVKDDQDIANHRDTVADLDRSIDLLSNKIKNEIDYKSLLAQHKLNRLSGFAFPLIVVTTTFGMNLETGLNQLFSPYLAIVAVITGLLFGYFVYIWMKRK
jgi:Mg2+ and Co2+ transporter CorA